jgi:hypothetical protein
VTMSPTALSAEAEASIELLFRTLGAHRVAVRSIRPRPPSRLRISSDSDAIQERCQATLVRLLSITEAFATELLLRKIDRAVAMSRNPTVAKVVDDTLVRATGNWADLMKSFKAWLGIDVDWKAVERLVEARNAVAHGLGTLTRRQRRNEQSVVAKLRAAGVAVRDGRIVLSDDTLAAAASACRDFIEELDRAAQSIA